MQCSAQSSFSVLLKENKTQGGWRKCMSFSQRQSGYFINEEDGNPFLLQFLSNRTELVLMCVLGTFCVCQHQSLTLLRVRHTRLQTGIQCWKKGKKGGKNQELCPEDGAPSEPAVPCIPLSDTETLSCRGSRQGSPMIARGGRAYLVLIWLLIEIQTGNLGCYAEARAEQNRQMCLPSWGCHGTEQELIPTGK